jgi:hypothetical protein
MPSKKTIVKFIGLIAILTILAFGLLLKSTDFADSAFRNELAKTGIPIVSIPEPEKRVGALRYKNIIFSEEHETSIDTLTITYTPLNWKQIKTITIDGLFISGELDINNKLTIANTPLFEHIQKLAPGNIESLTANDINFSILSAHFGGIRGTANISATKEQNNLTWTGNIDTRQNQLELIAKLSGQLNESGRWFNDFEVENAKLERSFGKFTRAHGTASWTGEGVDRGALKADLNAGAFIAYDTAWKNASITIETTPQLTKYVIAAKSAGVDELELGADALYKNKKLIWNARIHAPTAEQLINYLSANNLLPVKPEALSELNNKEDTLLQLGTKENSLIFNINNNTKDIDIKGKIEKFGISDYRVTYKTASPLSVSLKGNKCTKTKPPKQPICSFLLTRTNGKYEFKD